jgi:ADP-ribose pyrophosphatase
MTVTLRATLPPPSCSSMTGWYFKGMPAKKSSTNKPRSKRGDIKVLSSKLSYECPLFKVYTDEIEEKGRVLTRDVIRHNGSVVILAIDDSKSKRDPLIVMERQYRHAAKEYLLEVPAGKKEEGEDGLAAAKRELLEETGYKATRWRKMVRYFASPGFLGEFLEIFFAEGLTRGEAQPEYDEQLEIELMPLSKLLSMIEAGRVHDGKTLISVMLYDRLQKKKRRTATS